jgi:hypothetical protein
MGRDDLILQGNTRMAGSAWQGDDIDIGKLTPLISRAGDDVDNLV